MKEEAAEDGQWILDLGPRAQRDLDRLEERAGAEQWLLEVYP